MDSRERTPRIESLGSSFASFVYPRPEIPTYSEEILAETAHWAERTIHSRDRLYQWDRHNDPESRRLYLTWLTYKVNSEAVAIEEHLERTWQRQVDHLIPGSWAIQTNEGMLTCQIASAANALNFLYPQNTRPYTERNIVQALGGHEYVRTHASGATTGEIANALYHLTPHILTRRSNSVAEMLEASENGAAVMFPITSNHEALIPPGHHLQRSHNTRRLELQVADPMLPNPRMVPVESLLKSEISTVMDPELEENSVLIIEKGITTMESQSLQRSAIQAVRQTPIRTIRESKPIIAIRRRN